MQIDLDPSLYQIVTEPRPIWRHAGEYLEAVGRIRPGDGGGLEVKLTTEDLVGDQELFASAAGDVVLRPLSRS